MGYRFTRLDRIRRREDFLLTQKRGRRLNAAHFTLVLYDRRDEGPSRLGLVTSRKVAKAVGRNRVRRVLRETFRLHRAALFPMPATLSTCRRTSTSCAEITAM